MVYEPMDMNQQIHSMKSKVSSIDLRALASTVRSMSEDLTSRGNVVINDSKKLYGIIDRCLTRSPFKKRRLKGHLPQQIITVQWAMISASAKLVVLQHLSELSRFEIHTDLVIDLKPLIRPDGTPHPTQLKTRDERPTVLRRRDGIPTPDGETPSLVLPLGAQRSEDWAIMTLGDEWAYGTSPDGKILGRPDRHDHRRYSPYDVMTKISIELAGLESYDLQTVLAYSSSQHDFVMSEVGLLTDDDKGVVDDVYSSLVYGCRLPSMTMDQHQRDGRWMDGGSTDDEDDSMYDAPMELKQLLMTAVLGSCRMRPCDGVYDAVFLTGKLQEDTPRSPRKVLSEEESIDDPTTGDTTNDGQDHEDLDAQGKAEVIQRTYSLYQIDRYLQDMQPDGGDPYGSLTLPDIVVMMSLLCVLYNGAFPDVIGLDPGFPYYDALVHECLRFRTSLHGTIDAPEGNLYTTFSSESSKESETLRIIFKELEDVLINAVIHRLAAEFDGTYDEGLPEEYMIEDVSMDVHGRYSDVVESRLGKSTSLLRTGRTSESHA